MSKSKDAITSSTSVTKVKNVVSSSLGTRGSSKVGGLHFDIKYKSNQNSDDYPRNSTMTSTTVSSSRFSLGFDDSMIMELIEEFELK
jgi:hypothetical protein